MPPWLHSLMTTVRVHLIVVERGNISLLCERLRRSGRPAAKGVVCPGLDASKPWDSRGDVGYLSRPPGVQMTSAYFCDQPRRIKMETLAHPSVEKISYAAMPRRMTAKCGSAAQSNSFKPFSRASRDTEFDGVRRQVL